MLLSLCRVVMLFSFVVLVQSSCSGVRQMSEADREELQNNQSLQDRLSRVSGVTVTGSGANAQVRIRGGVNSFGGGVEPLFVLNGQPMNAYVDVFANVDPRRIKSIKVLKDVDSSAYGSRGGAGVIEVVTY